MPSIPKLMEILASPLGNDPHYILGAMRALSPLIRSLGSSQPKAAVVFLNKVASTADPFVFAELVHLMRETLAMPQLEKALASKAELEPPLRLGPRTGSCGEVRFI